MSIPGPPGKTRFLDGLFASPEWIRWFNQVLDALNGAVNTRGPYADDLAAKANGVAIGERYYQPSGAVVVRLV